jgi:hypothetical protein
VFNLADIFSVWVPRRVTRTWRRLGTARANGIAGEVGCL